MTSPLLSALEATYPNKNSCRRLTPEIQASAPPRPFVACVSLLCQTESMLYDLDPRRLLFFALV
jgi:hypothetical protein